MLIGFDIPPFQPGDEFVDGRRVLVAGNHHAVYLQVVFAENVYQSEDFQVVGDSEVLPCLAVDYVS